MFQHESQPKCIVLITSGGMPPFHVAGLNGKSVLTRIVITLGD